MKAIFKPTMSRIPRLKSADRLSNLLAKYYGYEFSSGQLDECLEELVRDIQYFCKLTGHKSLLENKPTCDYQVRESAADHFVFIPCGQPGKICTDGPHWQHGHVRCHRHEVS